MLLIRGNVVKMLALSQGAPAHLTLVPGSAHLFPQDYRAKNQMTSRSQFRCENLKGLSKNLLLADF